MIRSTFSGFTTAQLGLSASQHALQVTGQNIANINTEGYTRQRLDLVSLNMKNGSIFNNDTTHATIGYGVQITGISQVRDPFLDVQYRNEIAKVGTADAKQTVLDNIKNIFDETENEGVRQALSDLASSLDKLSSKVGNEEFDSIVRSRFQVLLNLFHTKAEDLKTVRADLEKEMEENTIPDLNGLLSEISELNSTIYSSHVVGNPALELQDERNAKIDELASYLPIKVTYVPHQLSTGSIVDTLEITLKGTDYQLVDDDKYASFQYEKDEDGKSSIRLKQIGFDNSSENISSYLTDGTLTGCLAMLNEAGTLGEGNTRGIGFYEKAFDSFVSTFAQTVNGMNKGISPDKTDTSFVPKPVDINDADIDRYMQSIEDLDTEIAQLNTDLNDPTLTAAQKEAKEAELAEKNEQRAEAYKSLNSTYLSRINSSLEQISALNQKIQDGGTADDINQWETDRENLVNDLKDKYGLANLELVGDTVQLNDGNGKITKLVSGKLHSTINEITNGIEDITDPNDRMFVSFNPVIAEDLLVAIDPSQPLSASNIKVSDQWMNNTIHIIASAKENAGSTDNDNIMGLIAALSDNSDQKFKVKGPEGNDIVFYEGSFGQCYSNIENTQGIDSKANTAVLTNHVSVLNEAASSRESVSGVSLDEEAMNLMQYQKSYSAAARLMTALDEVLDVLINKTGVVGR